MAREMIVAAAQLQCSSDKSDNFARATVAVQSAAHDGADLLVLPELFASLGRTSTMRDAAEPLDGPTLAWAQQTAVDNHCSIVAGSFIERDTETSNLYNTSIAVGSDGSLLGSYRKIHLFDVDIDGARSKESDTFHAGTAPVVVDISSSNSSICVGLTICYDLRFPDLFHAETLQGADLIVVPAAFTAATGRDHWELLLRARAVENQTMIIAAAQWGTSPDGIDRYGHSLIIDAWGRVLADAGPGDDTIVAAEFDASLQADIRKRMPKIN
jgi:predicted amidohydrolase